MKARITTWITLALIAPAMLLAAGCATNPAADPTPVQTWKITPAAGTPIPAPPTAVAPATVATGATGDGAATEMQIIGQDVKFDKTAISLSAGPVTIDFDNRDSGVPHNLHVFKGTSATGESVGATDLASGPEKQELKLDLQPGTYFFHCDAHPTTMKGTITVS